MSNSQHRENSPLYRLKSALPRSLGASELPHKRSRGKPRQSREMPTAAAYDGERLLPIRVVAAVTSWSRTSINRLVAEGKFPTPAKLGHKIAFRESEIKAYAAAQTSRS